MPCSKTLRCWILSLTAIGLALPVIVCIISAVAGLLLGMGDAPGGWTLYRIAGAAGIVWVIDLVCLVLALAIHALSRNDES
jgi:hypothetical protein